MTSFKPIELNTILFALRQLQRQRIAVKGPRGPMLDRTEIDNLCELLNFGADCTWPQSEQSDLETSLIEDSDGVVAHESSTVVTDPETGKRWALCWVRMDGTPKVAGQLTLPLQDTRRARPGITKEKHHEDDTTHNG